MDKALEIVWRRLIALMEKEQPEEEGVEEISDIIALAQKTLDKHPELGFKILCNEKTKQYKLTPRN